MNKSTAAPIFEHEMLREIYEQPQALADTIERYAPDAGLTTDVFQPVADALRARARLVIAASGSSRHAGLAAEIMLEDLAGLIVDVEYASEYVYRSTHTIQDPGVLVISQSGETADTLAGLREAKVARFAHSGHYQQPSLQHGDGGRCFLAYLRRAGEGHSRNQELYHPTRRPLLAGSLPGAHSGKNDVA